MMQHLVTANVGKTSLLSLTLFLPFFLVSFLFDSVCFHVNGGFFPTYGCTVQEKEWGLTLI